MKAETTKQVLLAYSEDPDQMLHKVAFHKSTLFAKAKSNFREIQYFLEIITRDTL